MDEYEYRAKNVESYIDGETSEYVEIDHGTGNEIVRRPATEEELTAFADE